MSTYSGNYGNYGQLRTRVSKNKLMKLKVAALVVINTFARCSFHHSFRDSCPEFLWSIKMDLLEIFNSRNVTGSARKTYKVIRTLDRDEMGWPDLSLSATSSLYRKMPRGIPNLCSNMRYTQPLLEVARSEKFLHRTMHALSVPSQHHERQGKERHRDLLR